MRTLVAILALSPALLHAQAKTPAQPVSTPTLQASLAPSSGPLADNSVKSAASGRISTGVVPARLIHSVDLQESSTIGHRIPTSDRMVVLQMTVDASGKPEDLKLVRSSDPYTNRAVMDAVSRFRYQPATISGVAVASPVNLEVTIRNSNN